MMFLSKLEKNVETRYVVEKSFGCLVLELVAAKNLKNRDVWSVAKMQRQLFSKVVGDKVLPKKDTVMAFCFGLKLSLRESDEFMQAAGYAFSDRQLKDVIVRSFLASGEYDVLAVNAELWRHNIKPLTGKCDM